MQRSSESVVTLRARVLERSTLTVVTAILLGILGNGLFSWINTTLSIPLFLDSIFTVTVAALFGPIAGVLTGVLSNLFQEFIFGLTGTNWQFGVVNGASGLIVGLLSRGGLFRTGAHAVIAVVLLTVANALLGAIVAIVVFGGATGVDVDYISMGLMLTGWDVFWAAFLARVPVNLADKGIAVVVAFAIYRVAFVHADD